MSSSECGVVASRGWTGGITLTLDPVSPQKCSDADDVCHFSSTTNMTESCLTAASSTPMTSSTLSTHSAPGNSSTGAARRGRASPAPVNRVPLVRQSEERRAKRCRFYRNGDRWFPGAVVAVSSDRHRTWDSLLVELTRLLEHPLHLAAGVRFVFTLEGTKIDMLDQLCNAGDYVASSTDSFKAIDYRAAQLPQWHLQTRRREALHVPSSRLNGPSENLDDSNMRPRLITVLRNGQRPRKAVRVLLNRRTARALDQVMEDLSMSLKLDTGAVRKIYTLDGRQVTALKELFEGKDVFIACGAERCSRDDFYLDNKESLAVRPLLKSAGVSLVRRRMPSPKPRGRAISPLTLEHSGSLPRGSRPSRGDVAEHRPPSSPHISFPSNEDLFLPSAISSRYRVGRVLGDGNFAVVRECRELVPPRRRFALKIIDKSKCEGKEDMIHSEVDILRKVRHENIVQLIEEVHCPDYLYLVMELVTGGDLFDAIAAATHYTESQAGHLIRDLASALQYLHLRNIVHRDVKPENLLVVPGPMPRLKLGDFGLAVQLEEPLYTICGTPTYVAPEILAEEGYGLEVDIWAAGVIAYILLCGFPPFISASNNQEELFEQILAGHLSFPSPYWDHVSPQPRHLIAAMVLVDPATRFTAEQVLQHPWLLGEDALNELEDPNSDYHQSADYEFCSLTAPPPDSEFDSTSGYRDHYAEHPHRDDYATPQYQQYHHDHDGHFDHDHNPATPNCSQSLEAHEETSELSPARPSGPRLSHVSQSPNHSHNSASSSSGVGSCNSSCDKTSAVTDGSNSCRGNSDNSADSSNTLETSQEHDNASTTIRNNGNGSGKTKTAGKVRNSITHVKRDALQSSPARNSHGGHKKENWGSPARSNGRSTGLTSAKGKAH